MTRLLVSVRSLDEALLAAAAAVDLIDVKEPTLGPLGMADANIRQEIGLRLGNGHQLSAACGELLEFRRSPQSSNDSAEWAGYRFAKIGLAGCGAYRNWREDWLAWRSQLPTAIEPVLVCYADGDCCDAPGFNELRSFAIEFGIRVMLFDTWNKSGSGLCELWQAADFLRVKQELGGDGISFVLAGKLGLQQVPVLSSSGASYLGIRGAVCDSATAGDDARCGKLNAAKIIAWQQALRIGTRHPNYQSISSNG